MERHHAVPDARPEPRQKPPCGAPEGAASQMAPGVFDVRVCATRMLETPNDAVRYPALRLPSCVRERKGIPERPRRSNNRTAFARLL